MKKTEQILFLVSELSEAEEAIEMFEQENEALCSQYEGLAKKHGEVLWRNVQLSAELGELRERVDQLTHELADATEDAKQLRKSGVSFVNCTFVRNEDSTDHTHNDEPDPPEYLEGGDQYAKAPKGTLVEPAWRAGDKEYDLIARGDGSWDRTNGSAHLPAGSLNSRRKVLRWGEGE